jgi:RHS repeat-associated protein
MFDKLRSYPKYFIFLITISLLFALPTFAQSVKPRLAKQTRANSQAEPVLTLTRDNLQKEAYKMWFYWYKAQQQGRPYAQPTLDIPSDLDSKEAQRVRSVWRQAQQQAQRDIQQPQGQLIKKMDMATAYKIWADWYLTQQQGKRVSLPNLIVSGIDEKEARRVNSIWEKARIKAQTDIQGQVASNKPQKLDQINNQPQNIQTVASPQANSGVHLSSAVAGGTPNTRLFAGQEYDPDLGMYYNRDRYLNTSTGRFLTQDSYEGELSNPLSLHKYLYAHANPVNNVDPSGRSIVSAVSAYSGFNVLANISSLQIAPTLAVFQATSDLMTLKLNLVYEKKGSIFYSASEQQEVFNTYVPPAKQAFGNIDIDFSITQTEGDAENVFNINRTITKGYVPGALNALFTKRGDPGTGRFLSSPEATNAITGSIFIGTKGDGRDPKNLAHGIIHALGIATKQNGFTELNAESTTLDVERALFKGRQDYTDKNSIYYKLRLWGAGKYLLKKSLADRDR